MKNFIQILSSIAVVLLISSFTAHHFFPFLMSDLDENAILTASDGASFDTFGVDVDISGDYAIVGARNHDANSNPNQGQAYIYYRSNAVWEEQAILFDPNGAANEDYGYSVAIDGNTAVVGAYEYSQMAGGDVFGKVYVYVRDGTNWNLQQELTASDGATDDWFGWSVAISGDYIIVGARFHDTDGFSDQGKAYIFHRTNDDFWLEQEILVAQNNSGTLTTTDNNFGYSVDIHNSFAIVGAHRPNSNQQGNAYVFERCGGTNWCFAAELTAGNTTDQFGISVAMNFNYIMVGAPGHDTNGNLNQGKVYVFDYTDLNNSSQNPIEFIASDGAAGDAFGASLDLALDYAVIGANQHDTNSDANRGKAYIFKLDYDTDPNGVWVEESRPIASDGTADDEFGNSVAISDTEGEIIIGAHHANIGNSDRQGKAYMYHLTEVLPVEEACNLTQIGTEQQVNTTTSQHQQRPAIAHDANGNFVVVWTHSSFNNSFDDEIKGQRYNAQGQKIGSEFQINSFVDYNYTDLDIAMDANGNFVVVWNIGFIGDYDHGVYARRFNSSGTPLAPEFLVNTDEGTSLFEGAKIAMRSTGEFVIAYTEPYASFVAFQRYESNGTPLGDEVKVSLDDSFYVDVDINESGDFNIIWRDNNNNNSSSNPLVLVKRYDWTGTPKDANNITVDFINQKYAGKLGVAMDDNGRFIAGYRSSYTLFSSDGNIIGGNTLADNFSSMEMKNNGVFVISNNSDTGIYDSDGTLSQTLNTNGHVAILNNGSVLTAYTKVISSGNDDIFLKRYVCLDENTAIPIDCAYTEEVPDDFYSSSFSGYTNCSGLHIGSERIYHFELTAPTNIDINFSSSLATMVLLEGLPANGNCIAQDNSNITIDNLTAGTYYLILERDFSYSTGILTFNCPQTLYVDDSAMGNNDGSDWTNAYTNLQDALDEASTLPTPQIWVAEGTYYPTKDQNGNTTPDDEREKTFYIDFDVKMIGGFTAVSGSEGDISTRDWHANPSILSGDFEQNDSDKLTGRDLVFEDCRQDNAYHVVFTEGVSNTFLMDGFYIQGGNANDSNSNSSTDTNNWGGAWLNQVPNTGRDSYAWVKNCHFSMNAAKFRGGAICNSANVLGEEDIAHFTVHNCIFDNNYGLEGAAIYNQGQIDVAITDIVNSLFIRNKAGSFSTIYSRGSHEAPSNSSLFTSINVTNCTVSGNESLNKPAGILGSNLLIYNSIFWDNNAIFGTNHKEIGNNASVNYSLVEGGWTGTGTGNLSPGADNYPYFFNPIDLEHAPFESGNLRIQGCSPAVDGGSNTAPGLANITTDLDGNPRNFDNEQDIVDIGAYESEFARCVSTEQNPCVNAFINCYRDLDGDGFGNPESVQRTCGFGGLVSCSDGFVSDNTDCNDNTENNGATANPNATEICFDFIDNNCNGQVDEICCPPSNVIYVDVDATGINDGSDWANAFPDFQTALFFVKNTSCLIEEIWIAEGTYYPSVNKEGQIPKNPRKASFFIDFDIKIYGGFDGTETNLSERDWLSHASILSGDIGVVNDNSDNAFHIIESENLTVEFLMDGLHITGGNANDNDSGGGWKNDGFSSSHVLTISNCQFYENNASFSGGAIINYHANLVITNCIFSGNTGQGVGGAICNTPDGFNNNRLFSLTNCAFIGNSAVKGGAIYQDFSDDFSSPPTSFQVINCSFSGNLTTNSNSGAIQYDDFFVPGEITNSILWGNGSDLNAFEDDITINNSIIEQDWEKGTNIYTFPPDFVAQPSIGSSIGDLRLDTCSPAINIGDNNENSIPNDLDNNDRIFDNIIDLGAYELQELKQSTNVTCYIDRDGDGFGDENVIGFDYCDTCPMGYADNNTDFNDDPNNSGFYSYPGAPEFCYDNVDNNNNGQINEDCFNDPQQTYTIYVNDDANGRDNGSDWENACNDFQAAMDMARSFNQQNGTIFQVFIAEGIYRPTTFATLTSSNPTEKGYMTRDFTFFYDFDVQLYGGFIGNEENPSERNCVMNPTILSGDFMNTPSNAFDDAYTVITTYNVSSDFILDGFIIENGTSVGNAGTSSSQSDGGGWYNSGQSNPTIRNCTFRNNSATNGGAFYNLGNESGGVSSPNFTNCIFELNSATGIGGAMYNEAISGNANPTFYNCVFVENNANHGSAIFITNPAAGGISSSPLIVNSSFSNNTGSAAITYQNTAAPVIHNSILWGNTAEIAAFDGSTTGQPEVYYSLISGGWSGVGNNNLVAGANPRFESVIGDRDLRLRADSDAIDVGVNTAPNLNTIEFDLDCNPRIHNAIVDMGAYEFGSQALAVEWLSFTAKPQTDFIQLDWQITTDMDATNFTIERSNNGRDWQTIGTTNQLTFNDLSPLTPVNYYRLTTTKTTGKTNLSPIVQVDWQSSTATDLSVFPNPTQGTIHWQLSTATTDKPTRVIVFDITGKVVFDQLVRQKQELDITYLPAGVYALKIEQLGQQWNTRFIKE